MLVARPFELAGDLVAAERGQAMEAQLEDRADLRLGQSVAVAGLLRLDRLDQHDVGPDLLAGPFAREQFFARLGRARRAADQLHHLVEVGDRDDQAEQDMGALAGLVELELGAAGDDLFAELDEALDEVAQGQRLGPAAADRQHVGREGRLRRRVPPQLVEDDFRGGVALQVDDDADAGAARFVANVAKRLRCACPWRPRRSFRPGRTCRPGRGSR